MEKRSETNLFQSMANSAPVLIWVSDSCGACTWFNKGWLEWTGRTLQQEIGQGWTKGIHPEDLDRCLTNYKKKFDLKRGFYMEYRLRDHSGTYRWISHKGMPHFDSEGEFVGYTAASLDIHEQKTSRDALAASEIRLENMIRTSPSFMCLLAGPDYIFLQANDQYLQLIGRKDIIGKRLIEVIPEIANQGFIGILDKITKTRKTYISKEVKCLVRMIPGGPIEKRFIDFVCLPDISTDGERRMVVHGVDVTDKVLSGSAIQNERENFRNLFRQTPEMVCILSGPHHIFKFVNESHIKALGFDATGMTVRESQPESVEVHCILDNVYRTGKTAELHEIPVTLGHMIRYFNLTYAARHDSEKNISGVMILGTEVTEQVLNRLELKRAKEFAQNANEAKTRFLANMSHEIRTPLSAILGFGELLRGYIQNHPQALDYIHRISRNASQLSRLIDELLDLSKIEAEKLEVEHETIDLDSLLDDVLSTLKLRAQEKSIHLRLNWVTPKPSKVVVDPLRLSQILSNVIGNAIKFTLKGSIFVELGFKDNQLKIRVIDTGIGIPIAEQLRIFLPFVQADTSVTRKYGGSGLGLALSKKLAQLLGGDLILEKSTPETGTTFKIYINIANVISETKKSIQKPIIISDQPLLGKKVLIVDDAPDNRVIANIFLQNAGAFCEEAENGQEGIDRALKDNFDIVLMDIQMPVLDGYQAMAKLTKLSYKKPVIALTAHALNDEKVRCMKAGFTDYVTKPINRAHLIHSILRAL